ncbi:MAG: hypothetical protein MSG64_10620 [Pyrinomonadaceae bacterium MAG19_C2-C3]|nr:hypothetical protein [Pyrinomonadaceae bacterium MAG19_C2-C3]
MISKRHLTASLLLVIACYANLFASGNQQPDSPFGLTLKGGVLQMNTSDGNIFTDMKLRLRLSDGTAVTGELEAVNQDKARDEAGEFERSRFRLNPKTPNPNASAKAVSAFLEVRHYLRPDVTVAFVDYQGTDLAPTDGVQLLMHLDAYARGMALKRFKLYWTAPVFTSDYRYLPPANQLLLWRRMQNEKFHLLVPLAGDGMISELGVADIDYRYEFRVSSSSNAPNFKPRRIPLFAYAASDDPYRLTRDAYQTAFAASEQYGSLRWEKNYPEIFRSLGWCSWNTYYKEVTEGKIINSVRSLRDQNIPVGFVLVDDGWLDINENKLDGFEADPKKFPNGLAGLAKTLRDEYRIPHVGVWHTFQGYWDGVNKDSDIGRKHKLFTGIDGKALPDPREAADSDFFDDWYARLESWGYDFVKIDNQSSNAKFTNGFLPLYTSGGGSQRNLQTAARKHLAKGVAGDANRTPSVNVLNCMEMTLENAYNWKFSNLARNSDDYLPDNPQNAKEHIYQNAYNTFWTSNFAYPDWDMFQTHDPNAEVHTIARAISGGPVYFTDEPGKERPELLRRLIFSDGRLLMLDAPGQVTRDMMLTDAALEPVPLKIFGHITRPGINAVTVAAFNVNKSAPTVTGKLSLTDIKGLAVGQSGAPTKVAVYRRGDETVTLLDAKRPALPLSLNENGFDLFTLSPVNDGIAVFGLLDKYLSPAAIVSHNRQGNQAIIRLIQAGDFAAWLEGSPLKVTLDGRELKPSDYTYRQGLLRVPQMSFANQTGEREIRVTLTSSR